MLLYKSYAKTVTKSLGRVDKYPVIPVLNRNSRRFESNNDLMHILIDSGFRRNDENFDFVHTP